MKLKQKFLTAFLLISIIPITVITLFTYERYTSLVNKQTNQVAMSVFQKAAEKANDSIKNINHIAEIFNFYSGTGSSIVSDIKKYSDEGSNYTDYDIFKSNKQIEFLCQNLIYSSDYINGIFLFTPSGVTLGYGYGSGVDIQCAYKPFRDQWYRKTLELKGKTYVDGISTKSFIIHSKPSISFSRAIYDVYSHKFLGVLYVDCSPEVFNLSKINTLPSVAMLTIENDSTGYTLYSNVDEFFHYGEDNHEKIKVMKQALDIDGLTLVTAINSEKLYREFGFTKLLILDIGVVCAIIFVIVSFLLSNYLTKPINYLSAKVANRSGYNMVTYEKYLKRSDEIGILCNEYNTMIEELNEHIRREYQNKLIILDSQMKSLEAQINSHFLYNTLESINSIAEIEGIESISTMSLALGNMFRYSIKTKSELVTIADELNHVKDYISIQKIRFDNQFSFSTDIPKSMLSMRVLKLILQPIVENALYHGLNYCNCGHEIKIKGSTDGVCILLEISDDGIGMTEEQLHNLQAILKEKPRFTELGQRNNRSIGLKNIHTRIRLYYGEKYGLSIKTRKNTGTIVKIRIPVMADYEEGPEEKAETGVPDNIPQS